MRMQFLPAMLFSKKSCRVNKGKEILSTVRRTGNFTSIIENPIAAGVAFSVKSTLQM